MNQEPLQPNIIGNNKKDGNSVFNKLKGAGAATLNRLRDNVLKKGSIAIFVILALLTISVLIAFLVIKLRSVNTSGTLIVGDPLKLYGMTAQVSVDQTKIPSTVNGQEFSFSFWLYFVDYIPTPGRPQLIFMRSVDTGVPGNSNPIVAMDSDTNTLYVAMRTNQSASNVDSVNIFNPDISKYLVSKIDYFPLQRWVHVVAVVKDDNISLYLNTSLYTVSNVNELLFSNSITGNTSITGGSSSSSSSNNASSSNKTRPVFSPCTGSMVIGPAGVASTREPRAFIAQLKFFNYAVTPKDIKSIYANGPSSASILAKLGLTGYGIRNPIYRVDQAKT